MPNVTVSFSLSLSHRLNYHPIVIISSPLPLFHCHYHHLIVVVIISLSSHYKSRYTTSPTVSPTLSLLHRVCVCELCVVCALCVVSRCRGAVGVSCERLTWISRAWYMIIRPSNITVDRLIRHFSANEYEDSYSRREKRGREHVVSDNTTRLSPLLSFSDETCHHTYTSYPLEKKDQYTVKHITTQRNHVKYNLSIMEALTID